MEGAYMSKVTCDSLPVECGCGGGGVVSLSFVCFCLFSLCSFRTYCSLNRRSK